MHESEVNLLVEGAHGSVFIGMGNKKAGAHMLLVLLPSFIIGAVHWDSLSISSLV